MLNELRRLTDHAHWADTVLLDAFRAAPQLPDEAVREYCHVLGAEEVWLSRLNKGPPARMSGPP